MESTQVAFGYAIAFLLPGSLGLYALSFVNPTIRDWFGTAAAQPAAVGGFLFAAAASLGIGLFLSGLRWLVIDRWFPPAPAFDAKRRTNAACERVYQDIRLNHYQFYQFYANTFCAVIILVLLWAGTQHPSWWAAAQALVGTAGALIVLWRSAGDALSKHDLKMSSLSGATCAEGAGEGAAVAGADLPSVEPARSASQ